MFEIEVESELSDAAEVAQERLDAFREATSRLEFGGVTLYRISGITLYRARPDDLSENLLKHQVDIVPSDEPWMDVDSDTVLDSDQ